MPYTLAMFLLWGVLMALIGGVVGWMLCRVRTRRAGPRGTRSHGPPAGDGDSGVGRGADR